MYPNAGLQHAMILTQNPEVRDGIISSSQQAGKDKIISTKYKSRLCQCGLKVVKIPKLLAEVCQLPVLRLLKGVHRPILWTLIEHLYLSCKIGSPYNTSPQVPINFKIKIVILSQ